MGSSITPQMRASLAAKYCKPPSQIHTQDTDVHLSFCLDYLNTHLLGEMEMRQLQPNHGKRLAQLQPPSAEGTAGLWPLAPCPLGTQPAWAPLPEGAC